MSNAIDNVEEKLLAYLETVSKDHLAVQRVISEVIGIENVVSLRPLPQLALVAP
jgi:hypothetical protein